MSDSDSENGYDYDSEFGYDSDPPTPPPVVEFEEVMMNFHTGIYDDAISGPLAKCSSDDIRSFNTFPPKIDASYADHLKKLEHVKDWKLQLNIRTGKEFKHSEPIHCQRDIIVAQLANDQIDESKSAKVQDGNSEAFDPDEHVDDTYVHTVLKATSANAEDHLATESTKMLLSTLSVETTKSLTVDRCLPGRFDVLAKVVAGMTNLSKVKLDYIRLGGAGNAVNFTNAMQSLEKLENIYLSHCGIGNNEDIIRSVMHSNATQVIMEHNNIGPEGARAIANCLASNKTPESILLRFNNIGDEGAVILANALKSNTSLERVWLSGNNFSIKGVKSLFNAVLNLDTLNTVSDSNHTCIPFLFEDICFGRRDRLAEDVAKHIKNVNVWNFKIDDRDPVKYGRGRKISYAIRFEERELLRDGLTGVPTELVPDVLSMIRYQYEEHGYRDPTVQTDAKVLGMTYSIVRKWPSLFSYRHGASGGLKRNRDAGA